MQLLVGCVESDLGLFQLMFFRLDSNVWIEIGVKPSTAIANGANEKSTEDSADQASDGIRGFGNSHTSLLNFSINNSVSGSLSL
jgi:hypothetical protein